MSPPRAPIRIGIDLGGGSIKLAVLRRRGRPRLCQSDPYDRPSLEELSRRLRCCWDPALSGRGVRRGDVGGVGLCVPGPMSAGGVLQAASNLPALVGRDVAAWARKVLALPRAPTVTTDALAAARGEHHARPRPGRTLYLSIGSGVGGLVMDDGEALLITRGTSGHLGHMDVSGGDPTAPRTASAGRGALEAYIGAAALQRAGVDLDAPDALRHPALHRALAALSRGLRIALALYRPDHIVLLGGVGLRLRPALPRLRAMVRADLTPAAPQDFTLSCGSAGYFAAAIGAALGAGRSVR